MLRNITVQGYIWSPTLVTHGALGPVPYLARLMKSRGITCQRGCWKGAPNQCMHADKLRGRGKLLATFWIKTRVKVTGMLQGMPLQRARLLFLWLTPQRDTYLFQPRASCSLRDPFPAEAHPFLCALERVVHTDACPAKPTQVI